MTSQLNTVETKSSLLFAVIAAAGVFIASAVASLFLTPNAQAISCGPADCYVSSTQASNSEWEDIPVDPTAPNGGNNGNNSGDNNRYEYVNVSCNRWLGGGGSDSGSYPLTPASCMNIPHAPICPARSDRSAMGWVDVYVVTPSGQRYRQGALCLYPTDEYAPIERKIGEGKIYVGGRAELWQTNFQNTAVIYSREGVLTDTTGYVNRGVNLSNPEAYTGSWRPSFTGATGKKSNGDPLYGYYRLLWDLDYKVCEKWGYPAWLGIPPRYDCSRGGQDRYVETYTYACNLSPALRAGIVTEADFRPSACEKRWTCSVGGLITINEFTDDLSTMRNGVPMEVKFPPLIVNTPSSDFVRSVRNEQTRMSVLEGSTPWNKDAVDANDKRQFFTASWEWDKWRPKKDGDIRFYWASDANKPFSFSTDYRFTADFFVTAQDSLNSGTYTRFASDTVECGTTKSAEITVLRSTTQG